MNSKPIDLNEYREAELALRQGLQLRAQQAAVPPLNLEALKKKPKPTWGNPLKVVVGIAATGAILATAAAILVNQIQPPTPIYGTPSTPTPGVAVTRTTGEWTKTTGLPAEKIYAASVYPFQGQYYLSGSPDPLDGHVYYRYDPAGDTWEDLSAVDINGLAFSDGWGAGDLIYFAEHGEGDNQAFRSFNTRTLEVKSLATHSYGAGIDPQAIVATDTTVVQLAGVSPTPGEASADPDLIYDPEADTWTELPTDPGREDSGNYLIKREGNWVNDRLVVVNSFATEPYVDITAEIPTIESQIVTAYNPGEGEWAQVTWDWTYNGDGGGNEEGLHVIGNGFHVDEFVDLLHRTYYHLEGDRIVTSELSDGGMSISSLEEVNPDFRGLAGTVYTSVFDNQWSDGKLINPSTGDLFAIAPLPETAGVIAADDTSALMCGEFTDTDTDGNPIGGMTSNCYIFWFGAAYTGE
jgi:hypothetical protein